jgi:phospholipase/carboxylesterase
MDRALRPRFLTLLALTAVAAACGGSGGTASDTATATPQKPVTAQAPVAGRVSLPSTSSTGDCAPGEYSLRLGGERQARLLVTPGSVAPRALVVVFHGAGGTSRDGLYAFRGAWKAPGLALLAPAARGNTWSLLHGPDTDVRTVNQGLARAWKKCRIDPRQVATAGFSDGATYALSLGLQNGDIFRAVMALSPGGVLAEKNVGRPRVFIAHGTRDNVLPISRTSEVIVRTLRSSGYSVTYRKFQGGHEAPEGISREAVRWFLRK